MAAATILDFLNFEILMVSTAKRVSVHHRTKFRGDRSNHCWDMAIFRLFKVVAVCHLGFLVHVFGPPTKGIWWSLTMCKIWLESMQHFQRLPFWKTEKLRYLSNCLTDCHEIWYLDAVWPSWLFWLLKFRNFKIQDSGGRHSMKVEKSPVWLT